MLLHAIDNFFNHDAAGGILLMLSAVAPLVVPNSAFSGAYESALGSTLAVLGIALGLLIRELSFDDPAMMNQVRLGVLSGFIISGIMGYAAL